jgi:hypothetical protein
MNPVHTLPTDCLRSILIERTVVILPLFLNHVIYDMFWPVLAHHQGNHPYTRLGSYFWLYICIIHMLTRGCPVHFYDKELQLIRYMQKNLETDLR